MTNEELCFRIQQGERELMSELWFQVERFVRHQANRLIRTTGAGTRTTADDLYQSGYLALMVAVNTFQPERGCSFIGWLALKLKTAFAEAGGWRRKDRLYEAQSLDAPLGDELDAGTLEAIIPDPDSAVPFEEAEERAAREKLHTAIEAAIGELPEEQSAVLRLRYYRGLSIAEAATEANVGIEAIRQRESKALRALRHPRHSRPLLAIMR